LIKRQRIFITGRVQGVGFRPAVYSIARKLGLSGFVYNDTKGVTIELQGGEEEIAEFLVRLQSRDRPPLAEIKSCKAVDIAVSEAEDKFIIETHLPGLSCGDGQEKRFSVRLSVYKLH
jgi:hydrogenase maturation protein HypF